jgi:hypothetical protein
LCFSALDRTFQIDNLEARTFLAGSQSESFRKARFCGFEIPTFRRVRFRDRTGWRRFKIEHWQQATFQASAKYAIASYILRSTKSGLTLKGP